MTINELREKRNQAWNAAKAFVETKRDKDGLLSDEDAKTYAQMEKKVQDYSAEIERMEAMSAMEAQLNRPTSSPITEKPMNGKPAAEEKPAEETTDFPVLGEDIFAEFEKKKQQILNFDIGEQPESERRSKFAGLKFGNDFNLMDDEDDDF